MCNIDVEESTSIYERIWQSPTLPVPVYRSSAFLLHDDECLSDTKELLYAEDNWYGIDVTRTSIRKPIAGGIQRDSGWCLFDHSSSSEYCVAKGIVGINCQCPFAEKSIIPFLLRKPFYNSVYYFPKMALIECYSVYQFLCTSAEPS